MKTETTTSHPGGEKQARLPVELFVFTLSMVTVAVLALAPHRLGIF